MNIRSEQRVNFVYKQDGLRGPGILTDAKLKTGYPE